MIDEGSCKSKSLLKYQSKNSLQTCWKQEKIFSIIITIIVIVIIGFFLNK